MLTTSTSTLQRTYPRPKGNRQTELKQSDVTKNGWKLTIANDKLYTSLAANTIMAKLTNHF